MAKKLKKTSAKAVSGRSKKTTKQDKMAQSKSSNVSQAQLALDDLDRVFHEKARLGIMTAMASSMEGLNFNELKSLCTLTDGNLNRHLKVLVDANALSVRKSGQGRNTNSHYKMTAGGRRAFQNYLSALETIVQAAQQAQNISGTSPA